MNQPLTFYTNPMSRGRIARWMLEKVNAFGSIDERPVFERYCSKLRGRDAYIKATAFDDAAMPAQSRAA